MESWPPDILRIEFHLHGKRLHEHYSPAIPRIGDTVVLGARAMPEMQYQVERVEWFFADREDGKELKPSVIIHLVSPQ